LAASAWVLLGVLGRALINTADEEVYHQAREVVALADAGRLADPVNASSGMIVQVLDRTGRITHATAGTDRLVPLLDPRTPGSNETGDRGVFLDGRPYGIPEPLRVIALHADHGTVVIVARSIGEVRKSLSTTAHLLVVGTPLLIVLLATASWVIIGRTLRPITALRRGAAAVSGTTRSRRLPVPESRDEVHSLATTLNDMLARLEAAGARQRALVSDAAHELRSPLASIRLQLEVALSHPDRQDWQETAEGVLEDTLRLARLAEDLLALARLDERGGAAPAHREPVDLDELVRQTAERYGEARVAVTVTSEGPVMVRGDAIDLGRVLTNLIDNAVRHAASKVEVRLGHDPGDAVITVTDDGPGIPVDDRERVFDRFTRLDTARSRDEGGAGLGLAIVRETVRAHGGTVHLEDASPGLRAVVRLPARVARLTPE
ncbi:MAG TPA: ATP-binding protein, partial [Thermopolyspora sp.]